MVCERGEGFLAGLVREWCRPSETLSFQTALLLNKKRVRADGIHLAFAACLR